MPRNELDIRALKGQKFYRAMRFDRASVNEKERTVEVAFASEEPYLRWWGWEITDLKAMDLTRLNRQASFLVNHDWNDLAGVIESARVDDDLLGRAVIRFGRSPRAGEILTDIRDGIRPHISYGYEITAAERLDDDIEGNPAFRVSTKPFEISSVTVPADITVGVGRSFDPSQLPGFDPGGKPPPSRESDDSDETRQPAGFLLLEDRKQMTDDTKTPEVDVEAISAEARNQARQDEQKRIRAIDGLGRRFKQEDLARQFIDNGKPVDEFQCALLEKMGAEPVQTIQHDTIPDEDAKDFSFVRLIRYMADPKAATAKAAGLELEMLSKSDKGEGWHVPGEVLRAQRDLTAGGTNYGSTLVGTDHMGSSFIELLRNKMRVRAAGARVLENLVGNLAIPRQSGGATMYWVAEAGTVTESAQTFDQVALSPKTAGTFTDMSRRLLIQSDPSVEMLVRMDLATTMALGIDYAAIAGNPDVTATANQPRGIIYTSGIGSVVGGTNGAAPTWDDIVDLETAVAEDNADVGALSYFLNAKTVGKLKKTKIDTGSGQFIIQPGDNSLNGYNYFRSNQVPSNLTKGSSSGVCSALIFGNFNDLILAYWSGIDVLTDPYTNGTSGALRVIILQDVDVAVRHAQSFAAMLDALTT